MNPQENLPSDETSRVALVIGGASGIGAAVTARLADEGLRVVAADLNPGQEAGVLRVDVQDDVNAGQLFEFRDYFHQGIGIDVLG